MRTVCGRDRFADLLEQGVFQLADLLLGPQHLLLVFLQLRRDEALGVGERLVADIVLRDVREVRLGDLDVVAEDLVVADLERADAGALPLALLDARDPALAFGADGAQFVKLGVMAFLDQPAFPQRKGGSS